VKSIGLWHFDEGSRPKSYADMTTPIRFVDAYAIAHPGVYSLAEFRVFDREGTNLATSGGAVVSSEQAPTHSKAKAIDGNTATYWSSQESETVERIFVDVGSIEDVWRVQLQWRMDGNDIPTNLLVRHKQGVPDSWTNTYSNSSYSISSPYLQDIDIHPAAYLDANVSWSDNDGEDGVGYYSREYAYGKVGNRTQMHLVDNDGATVRDVTWTMEYNDLNQLEYRYQGESWADGTSGEERVSYLYDANGNLTQEKTETYSGGWSETLKWVYAWNPRDQMKQATKYVNAALAGYVKYQYCLSCDGALSKRLQYNSSDQLTSEKRYEYDGLNLVRVDERCDADGDGIVEEGETTWRMVEVATHRPGQLGALVGKRVYSYPTAGNRCVSNGYTVYTYGYDAVGNVAVVYTGGGDEAFFFAQDAFGNELDIAAFASSDWVDARGDGVGEHQTGKWIDPFTGQYYFHARWYDSVVGRFVKKSPLRRDREHAYAFVNGRPTVSGDPSGNCIGCRIPPQPDPGSGSCFADRCRDFIDLEDQAYCLLESIIQEIRDFGLDEVQAIRLCCRPLALFSSDPFAPVKEPCRACHCYVRICDFDFGLQRVEGGGGRIDNNEPPGSGTCTSCLVTNTDMYSIISTMVHSIHHPPDFGNASALGPGTNCEEYAESLLEDNGVENCDYPWVPTYTP